MGNGRKSLRMPGPSKESFVLAKFLYPFLKKHSFELIFSILFIALSAISVLMVGYGIRILLDKGFQSLGELKETIFLLFILIGLMAFVNFGRTYFVSLLGEKIVISLQNNIFRNLLHRDIIFFEHVKSGALVSRLFTDTLYIQLLITNSLANTLRSSLIALSGGIFLFLSTPLLPWWVSLSFLLVLVPLIGFSKIPLFSDDNCQDESSKGSSFVEEIFSGIKMIKAFGAEREEEQSFSSTLSWKIHRGKKKTFLRAMAIFFVLMAGFSVIAFILWEGGKLVILSKISGGQLAFAVFFTTLVAGALGSLGDALGDFQHASNSAQRLQELLELPSLVSGNTSKKVHPVAKDDIITFNKVSFSYPNPSSPHSTLKDISFSIKPESRVAFIGESGAGKSTIFDLLLQFYTPQEGKIYLYGKPINEWAINDLREIFSYVPQEPYLFSSSMYDNIRIGDRDARPEEIEKAARLALVNEFSCHFPQGLKTEIGPKGTLLSAGQKQRIVIARGMLRKSPIVLLDEFASGLDFMQEKSIESTFETLIKGKTTLIIARSLSTILNLKIDKIFIIHKGVVLAEGSHKELMKKSVFYKHWVALQGK